MDKPPPKGLVWRVAAVLLTLLVLTGVVWGAFVYAGAWLASAAGTPTSADVVVVLGGDGGERYARARQLVLDGYSTRLLLINPGESISTNTRDRLRGVDVQVDNLPRSTWQEAQAVRRWMQAYGWKTVLVVSDPPHLMRVNYAFASNLRGSGLTFTLVGSEPRWWTAWHWWQNAESKRFVISEVSKMGYYLVRYGFGLF